MSRLEGGEEHAPPIGLRCKRMRPGRCQQARPNASPVRTEAESALKGGVGEAGALTNTPLVHVVEVSFPWETGGPHGQKRKHYVTGLCRRCAETAADPGPSRKGTPAAHGGEG